MIVPNFAVFTSLLSSLGIICTEGQNNNQLNNNNAVRCQSAKLLLLPANFDTLTLLDSGTVMHTVIVHMYRLQAICSTVKLLHSKYELTGVWIEPPMLL